MGPTRESLKQIGHELDAISSRTSAAHARHELGLDDDQNPGGTDLAVWSTIEDLRMVIQSLAIIVERLTEVTNLNTIEDRVDRWPYPSSLSNADNEVLR